MAYATAMVQDYIGVEPTTEFAVEVADEMERLVRLLDDEALATVVQLKLGGYSNNDIAEKLGCSTRTVIRKLKRIREEWAHEAETS